MKATNCIGDHEDLKKNIERNTKKPIPVSLSRVKAIHIRDNNKKMHFVALPNDMCTSTLKGVTPTRLFADSLGAISK